MNIHLEISEILKIKDTAERQKAWAEYLTEGKSE